MVRVFFRVVAVHFINAWNFIVLEFQQCVDVAKIDLTFGTGML